MFKRAKRELGEILSSFELMDTSSLDVVTTYYNLKSPVRGEFPFYVLVETQGSNGDHDEAKLGEFLEGLLEDGDVEDGTVTNEESKIRVSSVTI